jgi:hypothetical protein
MYGRSLMLTAIVATANLGLAAEERQPAIPLAPVVLYTDLVSGPVQGGERDLGAFVSIFGRNFGNSIEQVHVFFGAREVAAYRYLGPSKGLPDIQQITVQPGSVGAGSLPIRVVVNGLSSNVNHLFAVSPGSILFVDNVDGNDSRARANHIERPWRHLQTPDRRGALGEAGPGDVIVLRGKALWSDIGFEDHWARFWDQSGSAPTGRSGSGYITIEAYPGEDVEYRAPANTHGGIHGAVTAKARAAGTYIVIAGLRIESVASSASDGAPVNLQSSADDWRVVNNDLSWPNAVADSKAGGIAGNCDHCALLGNHIHDIGGGTQNHGIYLDGSEYGTVSSEVAYNWIAGTYGGNGIQSYNAHVGGQTQPNSGLNIHDNRIENGTRYGINLANGTRSAAVYDNVVMGTDYAGLRLNLTDANVDFDIHNNTFSNICRRQTPVSGAVVNTSSAISGSVIVRENTFSKGPQSTCSQGYVNDSEDEDKTLSFRDNQWQGFSPPPVAVQ